MQLNEINRGIMPQHLTVPHQPPFLARFLGKVVLDVLPAALASVIGGFLFTQYQFGHALATRQAAAEQVMPASAEMIQMVRDEHAMIVDYLKVQAVAEKGRRAADDAATARAIADAQSAADPAPELPARVATAVPAPKAAPRGKTPVVVASPAALVRAPLVIAQAEQTDAAPSGRLARDPDSLLAKTLDIKDHVVGAALNVVSAIGDVIGTVGGHLIGANPENAPPPARQFSSAS